MGRVTGLLYLVMFTIPIGRAMALPTQAHSPVVAQRESVGRTTVPPLDRPVTIRLRNVPLKQALMEIDRQASLDLAFTTEVVPLERIVTLERSGISAGAALREVLKGTGVVVEVTRGSRIALVRAKHADSLGTIHGRVTAASTGASIVGAAVTVMGTDLHAVTADSGLFTLHAVPLGERSVLVRFIGFQQLTKKVLVDSAPIRLDFALEARAARLDELVTTATGPQRRRDIGNSITTIRADSVLQTAPIRNLTDLLENRVPGLTVQHTSGAPGDPARLRLRGLGSIMRSNDPVVVVDGVRLYATQAEARSGNLTNAFLEPANGDHLAPAPSPLDQIDPNTIEKIEVFKGPSAATLYGPDAANGVIVVTTKRGKPGPTQWRANLTHGRETTPGRWPTGYYNFGHYVFGGYGVSFCYLTAFNCVPDSLVRFQALNESDLTVFGRGTHTGASLTASGGSQSLTYSVTGSYTTTTGLLQLPAFEVERFRGQFNQEAPDWMRRPHHLLEWSMASNVTARLNPAAEVTLTTKLARTMQERSSLESQLSRLAATYVDRATGAYYEGTSQNAPAATPTYLTDFYTHTTASALNFTASLGTEWHPRPWFRASGSAGLNVIARDDRRLLPSGLASPTDSGDFTRATGQSLVSTFGLQGTVTRPLGAGFMLMTSLGANLETQSVGDVAAAASGLVPGTSTITGATKVSAYEARDNSSVFGWYVEPNISTQRLSLSTGLRLDGGNTYGTRLRNMLALPKLNGSWVISEEPFFPFQGIFSMLRLRAEYGQAQVQPGAADRLRLYKYSTPDVPGVKLTTIGNSKLRPERSTEIGGGFDADILNSRVSVEFTLYRKTQEDALLPLSLPPSVNAGGTVLTNIGTIRNTGVELTLGFTPVRSPIATWTTQLAYNHNDNKLVELGRGVDPQPAQGLVAGYPVGGRWDKRIVGYADQNGNGVIEPSEIRLSDSVAFLGRLAPTHQATLFSNVALFGGMVGLNAEFAYETGATQVNEARSPVLWRGLVDPSAPFSEQAALLARTTYGRTEDIATFRFKTFSANYRAPRRVAKLLGAEQLSLAVQGQNLGLHSSYHGKDPDVNAWAPGENVRDTGQLPQPRSWQLRVDLGY